MTYLENEQLNDGGFPYDSTSEWFFGTSNSNSTGTVVSGLIAIGEDVTSSKWTKNEKTPIDCLLTYQNTDGGFFYEQGYNNDAFSFNQCLTALGDYKYNKSVYNRIINTNYKITKSDLLKEINKADALNESNYTIESFNEVKTNLANANVVYNNAESTDSDIYLATSLLRYSMLNLVKTTDNSKPSNTIKVSQTIKTSNGTFILTNQSYEVPDNSTVYDVLKTSLNLNNIPFTINGSGSNLYISSIGNYAEFAQGANSGFEYYVNGIKKTVSSAVCPLNSGDEIEWIYTTDYTTSETGTSTLDPVITPVETATTISAEVEKKQLDLSKVNVILEHVYNRYINKDELSSFEQIFLKLYTGNNNQIIINNIVTSVTECEGQYSKPTDLAKTCLALNFYEQDIHNINGIDLYDTLKNYDNLGKQGVNGYIYALFIASNENDTEFCDELIKNILSYQNADGGFSLAQNDTSDIDITAMALQALSFFDSEEVNASIENALQYIELGIQSDISSESISQVIIALSLLDIDVNNARFTVYSENLVDRLLTFKYDNSSFYHTKDEKFSDDISTEQAVLALVLLKNNYENTSDEEFISIFEKNDSELLSRLDFITLLNDIFAETNDEINENVFSDLSDDALTTFTVNHFNKLGVVKGINIDNSLYFKPDDFITKQDLAVYLTRYKTLPTIYRNVYPNDFDNLSSYSKDNVIEFLEFYNDLDSNGNFNPNDKVTFDYANTVLNSLVNFR